MSINLYELAGSGKYRAVTPADGTDLPDGPCKALLVGTAGTATLVDLTDTQVTVELQQGYNPLHCKRVRATGLTAGSIVALY